jgi:hypothetical protein
MSNSANRIRNCLPLVALLVGTAVLGAPTRANAAFTLTLHETGFTDVVVTDNNILSGDVNPATGQISYVFAFGTFTGNIISSMSNSADAVDPAHLSTTTLNVTGVAGSSLTVTVEDTGFTVPAIGPASMLSEISNTQSPLSNATITYQSFLNGAGGTVLTESGVAGDVKASDAVTIGTNPYTLKSVTNISLKLGGTVNTTGITEVSAVPVPAGLVLALTGMPFLGIGCWLRRRTKA